MANFASCKFQLILLVHFVRKWYFKGTVWLCQNLLNEIDGHLVKSSVFVSGTSPDQDSSAKLKRLLHGESPLLNEYVGDARSRINAIAG